MGQNRALNKIRKLLAMADKNSGATENEMHTALALAKTLMRRYHLSQYAVQNFQQSAS
jgi:Protein of unknown function (DUF2786)